MKLAFALGTLVTALALAVSAPSPSKAPAAAPAAVAAVEQSTAAVATAPADDLMVCPPTVYECCDGSSGSGTSACTGHGGKCGILYICGRPY